MGALYGIASLPAEKKTSTNDDLPASRQWRKRGWGLVPAESLAAIRFHPSLRYDFSRLVATEPATGQRFERQFLTIGHFCLLETVLLKK